MCVCVCVCVCVVCQAHQIVCKSFDNNIPVVFENTANSKICSHVVRPDRSLSLFYSLHQDKRRPRSSNVGFAITVILLQNVFYLLKRLLLKCRNMRYLTQ